MTHKKHPRLSTPVINLAAGTGIACAFGVSHSWTIAVIAEVVAISWPSSSGSRTSSAWGYSA